MRSGPSVCMAYTRRGTPAARSSPAVRTAFSSVPPTLRLSTQKATEPVTQASGGDSRDQGLEPRDVRTGTGTVRSGGQIGTGRLECPDDAIGRGQSRRVLAGREAVSSRIACRDPTQDQITGDHAARGVRGQGTVALAAVVALHPVGAPSQDVPPDGGPLQRREAGE